jgi:UDP-N-acetylmuramate: L-alanyl-gamma-D-glutamyl-meso-diaminopimelate ligase
MNKTINRIHFIAIGGSVMHNLALALRYLGYEITGSDDEIYEPAKSKLQAAGLHPEATGWDESRINNEIDAIILGMHAKKDNPELLKAQELGIPIYSYPEFIYHQSRDKQRVVIAGSHGKTSTTAMVMHVLQREGRAFDFLLGANIAGFDNNVQLSDAPLIIIEGDEYLSSPLDLRPKFIHYQQHIGLITGIAWDHINVYPEFDDYVHQFELFAAQTPTNGRLFYFDDAGLTKKIGDKLAKTHTATPYQAHPYRVEHGKYILQTAHGEVPLHIFGDHNMQNLQGALHICEALGVSRQAFYRAIDDFSGAGKRLELLAETTNKAVFKDFAHAPSKVRASVNATKDRNPERALWAILELHTFSSLHPDFIGHYRDSLQAADQCWVYINPNNLKLKNASHLNEAYIKAAFNRSDLHFTNHIHDVLEAVQANKSPKCNYLWMSSGNFASIDLTDLAQKLIS